MRRARAIRRPVVAALVVVTALLSVLSAPTASADPISEKRAEAERVAAGLDELEQRLSALDEEYNAARLHLAEVEADMAAAQRRADEAAGDLADTEAQLKRFAVQAYVSSGDAETLDAVIGGDMNDLGERQAYASVATGSRADLLDELALSRQRSQAEVADLDAVKAEAAAVEAQLASARDQADAAVAEQDALRRRVEGELAGLVAEEQARRAAEEQRRAEEAARRAAAEQAARQAAAPQATTRATTPTTARPGSPTTTAPTGGGATTTAPSTTVPSAPLPGPSGDVGAVIAAASTQIGTPYVWAGSTPAGGFDCSGFTMWAWSHGGRSLPHSAAAQMGMTRRISRDQLQPGDLVFYGSPVHHVALYIGGNTIVHAPGRGRFVRYDSVDYWSAYAGAGRL